jgi:endonuclease-8
VRAHPNAQIADVLLDQCIFGGVGNIIKNEVLFRTRTHPLTRIRDLRAPRLRAIIVDARVFSLRFLELRRVFSLRRNLEIYGKSTCLNCGGSVHRKVHGTRERRSFFCPHCQPRAPRQARRRDTRAR